MRNNSPPDYRKRPKDDPEAPRVMAEILHDQLSENDIWSEIGAMRILEATRWYQTTYSPLPLKWIIYRLDEARALLNDFRRSAGWGEI